MEPVKFPQADRIFGAPKEQQSQVLPIYGRRLVIDQGPFEGLIADVVAWKPSAEDLAKLNAGEPVFISFYGGVIVHSVSVEFPFTIHTEGADDTVS
jgi:hypothetical protein